MNKLLIKLKQLFSSKIGLVILIIIVLIISLIIEPEKEKDEFSNENIKENINITTDVNLSANKINFLTERLDIPEKADLVKIDGSINYLELAKNFGFDEIPLVNQEDYIAFANEDYTKTFDVNKKDSVMHYKRNIVENYELTKNKNNEVDEIKIVFEQLMKTNLNVSKSLEITINNISYEEVLGPRYVSSTYDKSNVVKIEANYKYEKLPIMQKYGYSVSARFSWNGELLDLRALLIPIDSVKKQAVSLISFNELKQSPNNNFKIINMSGNRDFDQYGLENNSINEVNITSGFSGYLYQPNNNWLIPVEYLEGNGLTENGPIKIILSALVTR